MTLRTHRRLRQVAAMLILVASVSVGLCASREVEDELLWKARRFERVTQERHVHWMARHHGRVGGGRG